MIMGTVRLCCALLDLPAWGVRWLVGRVRRPRPPARLSTVLGDRLANAGGTIKAQIQVGNLDCIWLGVQGRRQLARFLVETIRQRGPVLDQFQEQRDGMWWLVFRFQRCQVRLQLRHPSRPPIIAGRRQQPYPEHHP